MNTNKCKVEGCTLQRHAGPHVDDEGNRFAYWPARKDEAEMTMMMAYRVCPECHLLTPHDEIHADGICQPCKRDEGPTMTSTQRREAARDHFRHDGKAQIVRGPYLLRIGAAEGARAASARAVHGARRGLHEHAHEMEVLAVRMSIIADRAKAQDKEQRP